MANEQDFNYLKREISNIEKKFDTFETQANSNLNKIINAKFNSREYGNDAIEKKVSQMLNNCSNKIEKESDAFINEIKRHISGNNTQVKNKVKEINDAVAQYNNEIAVFNALNTLFKNGNYTELVDLTDKAREKYDKDSREYKYILFLELESLDKICNDKIESNDINDEIIFKKYDELCKTHNARKHLKNATKMYGLFAANILTARNDLSSERIYEISLSGLENLKNINGVSSQKKILYQHFKTAFNELSEIAYNSFDYLNVKKHLESASNLAKDDINIGLFKNCENIVNALFEYTKDKYNIATLENILLAITDTISLSKDRVDYLAFWIGNYDNLPKKYLPFLLNKYENYFEYQNFDSYNTINSILEENIMFVHNLEGFSEEISNYYLSKTNNKINLVSFITFEISFIKLLKTILSQAKESEKNNIDIIYRGNIAMIYPLIKKYQKKLCSYTNLNELNALYKDSSLYLTGKSPKKMIDASLNQNNNSELSKLYVKSCNFDISKARKKNGLIIGAIVSAVLVITLVIIFIFISK